MLVLGIETTCDEASAAIVCDGKEIFSNVVASQMDLHKRFGGVYPELASRQHVDLILHVIDQAIKKAGIQKKDIELICVAQKPGLIGSLLIGMNTAKALSLAWDIPFVGVDHIKAHIYAAMMGEDEPVFPSIGVVISGGHTTLFKMENVLSYEKLGGTIDDAVGEAFDKVAALLGLPYPGGPEVEKLAQAGRKDYFSISPCQVKNNPYNFSFSGLKTKILYLAKGKNSNKHAPIMISDEEKGHLAAGFQHAALSDVVDKSLKAYRDHNCKKIYLGGGVTQNKYLRNLFQNKATVSFPLSGLSLDNGAMIAGLGFHLYQKKQQSDSYEIESIPTK